LDCYPLMGSGRDHSGRYFTFPEYGADGSTIVGIATRYQHGKFFIPGGTRGIIIPDGLDVAKVDVLHIVEGPTDVASMWTAGLPVVGRPSNTGGAELLMGLLTQCHDRCRILVVGENDQKADGNWPGLHGAASVAERLALALGRRPGAIREPVRWAICPGGAKDVREWFKSASGEWKDRGVTLAAELSRVACYAESQERTTWRLLAENVSLRERLTRLEQIVSVLAEKTSATISASGTR
jgi:hypothetical protein